MKTCNECFTTKELDQYPIVYKIVPVLRDTCKNCIKTHQRKSNNSRRTIYMQKQYDTNPIFRMYNKLRSDIRKGASKNLLRLYGYDRQMLIKHLEKQFSDDMNWGNYGTYWEVDHIVSATWMLKHAYTIREINALNNLRPLKKTDNRKR